MADQRNPVAKVFTVLTAMADEDVPRTIREIARATNLPPSTVHRLFAALVPLEVVERDRDGAYRLGLEFYRMAARATARTSVTNIAVPGLQRLVEQTGETAYLALYSPVRRHMIFVERVECAHPLRYVVELNQWAPISVGASGLAILAFLPAAQIDFILKDLREQRSEVRTDVEIHDLIKELERIRERGYAFSIGQRTPGAVGFAAPIRDAAEKVIGDIGLTVPEARFEAESQQRLATLLMLAASDISGKLGASVSHPRPRGVDIDSRT